MMNVLHLWCCSFLTVGLYQQFRRYLWKPPEGILGPSFFPHWQMSFPRAVFDMPIKMKNNRWVGKMGFKWQVTFSLPIKNGKRWMMGKVPAMETRSLPCSLPARTSLYYHPCSQRQSLMGFQLKSYGKLCLPRFPEEKWRLTGQFVFVTL